MTNSMRPCGLMSLLVNGEIWKQPDTLRGRVLKRCQEPTGVGGDRMLHEARRVNSGDPEAGRDASGSHSFHKSEEAR